MSKKSSSPFRVTSNEEALFAKVRKRGPDFLTGDFTLYEVADENYLRIVPPLADDDTPGVDEFGLPLQYHFIEGVGYQVCPKSPVVGEKTCPLCAVSSKFRSSDPDLARELRAGRRRLIWVLDLNDKNSAVKLWSAPPTLIEELVTSARDRRTGRIISLVHPVHGHPFFFRRTGQGRDTRYVGIEIEKEELPLPGEVAGHLRYFREIVVKPDLQLIQEFAESVASGSSPKKSNLAEELDDEIPQLARPSPRTRKSPKQDDEEELPFDVDEPEEDEESGKPELPISPEEIKRRLAQRLGRK